MSLLKVVGGVTSTRRWRALGGVIGPAGFIAAWAVLGSRRPGYSPVDDPISRLAAVDASTRWAMTAGFVTYGAGVSIYATALRNALPGGAALGALTSAVATVGVAMTPLGSALGGTAHATCASVGYLGLAATPLLAGQSLAAQGRRTAGRVSTFVGALVGVTLLASVLSPAGTGLFQRIGLTAGDVWLAASGFALLKRPYAGSSSAAEYGGLNHRAEG